MNIANIDFFNSIKDRVKLDLLVNPNDPFEIGDAASVYVLRNDVTAEEFEQICFEFNKDLINKWVNAEFMAVQIYSLLKEQPELSAYHAYFDKMVAEEISHTSVAYYFYKTAFAEEPSLEYIPVLPLSYNFTPAYYYIFEVIATSTLFSICCFTNNDQKKSLLTRILRDDVLHVKYLNDLLKEIMSIQKATAEEKFYLKNFILSTWNSCADLGQYGYFEKNFSNNITDLKKEINKTALTKAFQKHFHKQITKWLKKHKVLMLIQ